MTSMQAVILAGGLGTRLGEITERVPKPMVRVAGKPYLEHQLELLRGAGIRDYVFLVGYLGEQIRDYFGDGSVWGVKIEYSIEASPMGTGGALRDARRLLAAEFLLVYGDSYLPIDYGDVHEALMASGKTGLMVVYDNALGDTTVRNNVSVQGGRVTRYEKAAHDVPGLDYVEAGVLAFRRPVIGMIPAAGVVSIEKEVFPELIQAGELAAYVTKQRFYDIGTPERLRAFEKFLHHDHHADTIPD